MNDFVSQKDRTMRLVGVILIVGVFATYIVARIRGSGPPRVDSVDKQIALDVQQTVASQLNGNTDVVERHGKLVSIETLSLKRLRASQFFDLREPARLEMIFLCKFENFKAKVNARVFKGATFQLKMEPSQEFVRKVRDDDTSWEQVGDQLWFVHGDGSIRSQSLIECRLAHPDFVEK